MLAFNQQSKWDWLLRARSLAETCVQKKELFCRGARRLWRVAPGSWCARITSVKPGDCVAFASSLQPVIGAFLESEMELLRWFPWTLRTSIFGFQITMLWFAPKLYPADMLLFGSSSFFRQSNHVCHRTSIGFLTFWFFFSLHWSHTPGCLWLIWIVHHWYM